MSPQNAETRNVEHLFALIFTFIGGVFWIVTAFMGSRGITIAGTSTLGAFTFTGGAFVPLVYTVLVLLIGYSQELIAAIILLAGAVLTVIWGIVAGWESSVWWIMAIFFMGPTIVAAVLFYLAHGRSQKKAVTSSTDVGQTA